MIVKVSHLPPKEQFEYALECASAKHPQLRAIIDKSENPNGTWQPITSEEAVRGGKFFDLKFIEHPSPSDLIPGLTISPGKLFHITAVTTPGSQASLLIAFSHAVMDGWSRIIFIKDLFEFIRSPPASPNEIQPVFCQTHVLTNHPEWLQDSSPNEEKGEPVQIAKTPANHPQHVVFLSRKLAPETVLKLRAIARKNSATLNSAIAAALSLGVIHSHGDKLQFPLRLVAGAPANVRSLASIPTNVIGNYAMPCDTCLDITANSDIWDLGKQFTSRMEEIIPKGGIFAKMLFGTKLASAFVFSNLGVIGDDMTPDVDEIYSYGRPNTNSDFIFASAHTVKGNLCFGVAFSQNVFAKETVEELLDYTFNLLERVAQE